MERTTLARRLNAAGVAYGDGVKIPLRAAIQAVFGEDRELERQAKAARHRQAIDEAEMVRHKRAAEEERWIPRNVFRDAVTDAFMRVGNIIRNSKLSKREQEEAIRELRGIKLEDDDAGA